MALAASDAQDDALLDMAIDQSRQEAQSFTCTILTRSNEVPLPMVPGYTKQLWVDRATRNPIWFSTLTHLRTLLNAVDPLLGSLTRSFRPDRSPT